MWCVAELDEDYIAKMEDVLETYERPYDPQEPVVCLDEKPVTLHADVRPASPAKPGREARQDNEYKRRGTANVFCAVEPKAGRHFTFPTPDRSGVRVRAEWPSSWRFSTRQPNHPSGDGQPQHPSPEVPDGSARRARSAARSGTASRFITRPLTEVGSIRRKSKSACFSRQCLGAEEFPISRLCGGKLAPGIAGSIAPAPKSTGSSTAKPPDASSAIKGTLSRGHRPRTTTGRAHRAPFHERTGARIRVADSILEQ